MNFRMEHKALIRCRWPIQNNHLLGSPTVMSSYRQWAASWGDRRLDRPSAPLGFPIFPGFITEKRGVLFLKEAAGKVISPSKLTVTLRAPV